MYRATCLRLSTVVSLYFSYSFRPYSLFSFLSPVQKRFPTVVYMSHVCRTDVARFPLTHSRHGRLSVCSRGVSSFQYPTFFASPSFPSPYMGNNVRRRGPFSISRFAFHYVRLRLLLRRRPTCLSFLFTDCLHHVRRVFHICTASYSP